MLHPSVEAILAEDPAAVAHCARCAACRRLAALSSGAPPDPLSYAAAVEASDDAAMQQAATRTESEAETIDERSTPIPLANT